MIKDGIAKAALQRGFQFSTERNGKTIVAKASKLKHRAKLKLFTTRKKISDFVLS